MTEHEIREYVERLTLQGGFDSTAPDGFRAFAFYVEIPGCMALGATPAQAVAELGQIIVPFVGLMIDRGAELPTPSRERVITQHMGFGPLFVGDRDAFDTAGRAPSATRGDASTEVIQRNFARVA